MDVAKRVSIHIADWQDVNALQSLLDSLSEQTFQDFQIVVVDDGAASSFRPEAWPNVVRLRAFRDLGYARGHNQALTFALSRWEQDDLSDRYVLLLDETTRLAPDALERLVRALSAEPAAAAAGPKLFRADLQLGEDERPVVMPSDRLEAAGVELRRSRRPLARGEGERDQGQFEAGGEVFGFAPACVLLRASAMREACLPDRQAASQGEWLDPELHRGQELLDLFWRLRWLGKTAFTITPG